ncbi:CU044_2847 family protein [Streptosporangium sp. NPDC000239]|uniref:CU044_2847 family protein n=1 Tax=Streptosporangium jomthongense TaxID=1193683 RepID=A0ABV8F0W2_9ACTN
MAKQLVRWEIDGGTVVVETDEEYVTDWVPVSSTGDRVIYDARQRFEEALKHVRGAAETALRTFRESAIGPDEVEVEFGVKLGTEAGAVIAKASVEGNLTVRVKWSGTHNHEHRG